MENNSESKYNLKTSDYAVLLIVGLFYYIDFLPNFRAIEIRGVQFLYMALLNLIIGVSFFAFPKFVNSDIIGIFKKSLFVKMFIAFLGLSLLSIIASRNAGLVLVVFSQLLVLTIMIFNLCILLYGRLHVFYHICFMIGVFSLVKCFTEITLLFEQLKTGSLRTAITFLKGNTGNINIFSASLNVKMPFLILGIMHFQNWKKWILILSIIFSTIIIYLLDSRATLLALILEVIAIVGFLVWKSADRKKIQLNVIATILPIIIGVSIGV